MESYHDGELPESRRPTELQILVCDLMRHRLQQGQLEWASCPIHLTSTSKISLDLRALIDDFRSRYEDHFQQMAIDLHLERDPVAAEAAYLGIVGELFCEGIKWAYIIALFVLNGEFALIFASKRWTEMLDHLMNWTVDYINVHLSTWIQEHGGWEYMVHHYKKEDQGSEESAWPRLKHLVCGVAAGALGVLTLKAILSSKS